MTPNDKALTCGEEEELLLHELAVVEQHLPEVVDGLVPRPVPVIHHHLQQYSTVQYSTVQYSTRHTLPPMATWTIWT